MDTNDWYYIAIDITPDMRKEAERRAAQLPKLNNSILNNEGAVTGFLGELAVSKHFGFRSDNTFDFDLIAGDKRIEVKSKTTKYIPRKNYIASVTTANCKQDCDIYYFTQIDTVLDCVYLLGGISRKNFYEKAIIRKKGELCPVTRVGYRMPMDCWNIALEELKQPNKK